MKRFSVPQSSSGTQDSSLSSNSFGDTTGSSVAVDVERERLNMAEAILVLHGYFQEVTLATSAHILLLRSVPTKAIGVKAGMECSLEAQICW